MIGNIYKIECITEPNIIYIGSTENEVRHRWQAHKHAYSEWLIDNKRACLSIYKYFIKYGIGCFKASLIKSYTVIDKQHLHSYEQLYINKFNCVNKNNCWKPASTKRFKKEYDKIYNEENKEKKAGQKKIYREKNKQTIKEYRKKYYIKNKEKNKDKIKTRKSEKYTCACGSEISKGSKTAHLQTKKHIKYLNPTPTPLRYTCECGVELSITSKNNHNSTVHHLRFMKHQQNSTK